jgi:hypothetical protein
MDREAASEYHRRQLAAGVVGSDSIWEMSVQAGRLPDVARCPPVTLLLQKDNSWLQPHIRCLHRYSPVTVSTDDTIMRETTER